MSSQSFQGRSKFESRDGRKSTSKNSTQTSCINHLVAGTGHDLDKCPQRSRMTTCQSVLSHNKLCCKRQQQAKTPSFKNGLVNVLGRPSHSDRGPARRRSPREKSFPWCAVVQRAHACANQTDTLEDKFKMAEDRFSREAVKQ
ncbi:hypothetical protein BaRGS_00029449 [Batillaria attramentaria]|uniref:Uncharacterized protein n=1 Tax=Batillaria attramentaria TaxID=370345 RepID=A0ABD0JX54_9CAEN